MILADTSIWVAYLRSNEPAFAALLAEGRIAMHTYVIGELAVGSLKDRIRFIEKLHDMPQIVVAADDEVLGLIERKRLFGLGIGYVDAHLVASVQLTPGTSLWTRDKRLHMIATNFGVAYSES